MSIFADNIKRLREVQKLEEISDTDMKLLLSPRQINKTELVLKGKKYPAWRIVYNYALGPGKGGIRFHPEVSEDEVQSLAFWMALKNSLADIPYGGAKGGIKFNPKEMDPKDLEKLSRLYIDYMYPYLGQDKDIPAPDVYTNSQIMAWMLDQYEKKVGHHEPGMITGKPLELGGLALRGDATAQGAYIISKEMIAEFLPAQPDIKIVVQGFGNAGLFMAEKLYNDGHKIIAVSDSQGGIYDAAGLNIKELIIWKNSGQSVVDYQDGRAISNAELLELETDILVLAALENQITKDNAKNIKAKYLIELANGPITYEADQILAANKRLVVPDILANSGGVIVSYFEWAQNRTGQILDEEYLKDLLGKKMKKSWDLVYSKYRQQENKISLRLAAYAIAVLRILAAEKWRGNN
ncbi:MAG: Glu/Leu/Phe/Val dehydrogenase [Candidatus Falkowbacteria bacterium]|nr:Glu/Leu/Phe/Val dehydrogenase [Candidatus Falkowbacteria bacterium]